jgi:hypothetical protein
MVRLLGLQGTHQQSEMGVATEILQAWVVQEKRQQTKLVSTLRSSHSNGLPGWGRIGAMICQHALFSV